MNKFFCFLTLTCFLFSCKSEDKNENQAPSITVDTQILNFAGEGGSMSFRICSNTGWIIERPVRWHVSSMDGNGDAEITVTAPENPSSSAYTDKLTIIAKDHPGLEITLEQPGLNKPGLPQMKVLDEPSGGFAFDLRQWIRIRTEITGADAVAWLVNGREICGEADLLHVMTIPGDYTFRMIAKNELGENFIEIPVTIRSKTFENNVTKLFEYLPAPGQYTNVMPVWKQGDTQEAMNAKALAAIRNRNGISLGGFGGYVVMGFDHVLLNTSDAYDFRIKGNALPTWAEPGVIMVSYDANGNGLPDDEWFEIAGSAYKDASTIKDYEITYTLAQTSPMFVTWKDNKGVTGEISQNAYRGQNYFPGWLSQNSYTLKGTRLTEKNVYDSSGNGTYWVSKSFEYGYADNCAESQDCSKIEIDWAVDKNGNPVKLKGIDFIRVHCSMNFIAGWQGEVSTEIYGFEEFNVNK